MEKYCICCKQSKDSKEFGISKGKYLQTYCRECVNLKSRERSKNNPEKKRNHYWGNRERALLRGKAYRLKTSERQKFYSRESKRRRRLKDPLFRVTESLRNRTHIALKRNLKSAKTKELLSCPLVWLQVHIESLFRPGMTWENYGPVWHIDHIRPCASFDLSNPEQQKICFHWTNLQPLFVQENLSKGSRIDNLSSNPSNSLCL